MFKKLENALNEGRRRYGPLANDEKGATFKCDECTDYFWTADALERHKKNLHQRENADRDQGDYAKCSCGDEKAMHTEPGGGCFACACTGFKGGRENTALENVSRKCPDCKKNLEMADNVSGPWGTFWACPDHGVVSAQNIVYENGGRENADAFVTKDYPCEECGSPVGEAGWTLCKECNDEYEKRMNASGKLIVSGGDSKKVAFVHCRTCDEGIEESRIQDHVSDGHTVEKVMKVENAAGDIPAAALGYDYATSTTTATPGKACKECGHIIGQVFADGVCVCGCHKERANADSVEAGPYKCLDCGATFGLAGETWYRCEKCKSRNIEGTESRENCRENSIDCPACGEAVSGGVSAVETHLEDYHDMTEREAEQAIGAYNAANADANWVCAYDGTSKKLPDGRCAACGRASKEESERDAREWDRGTKS